MLILALESSAKPASVAVFEKNTLLGYDFQNSGYSHSRTLLLMAQNLLNKLSLKPTDIGIVAVANGPGSFTGVRIGVSAAKGFAFGLDIPINGVSTLEAMAWTQGQTQEGGSVVIKTSELICPVMDARRNQVYNALFKRENGRLIRLREDRAISIEDLISDLKRINEPFIPVGDGTDLFVSYIKDDKDLRYIMPDESKKYQSALGVALASIHKKPVTAAELVPVYLRPSQAERMKKESD